MELGARGWAEAKEERARQGRRLRSHHRWERCYCCCCDAAGEESEPRQTRRRHLHALLSHRRRLQARAQSCKFCARRGEGTPGSLRPTLSASSLPEQRKITSGPMGGDNCSSWRRKPFLLYCIIWQRKAVGLGEMRVVLLVGYSGKVEDGSSAPGSEGFYALTVARGVGWGSRKNLETVHVQARASCIHLQFCLHC